MSENLEISKFRSDFLEIQCDFCTNPAFIRFIDLDHKIDDQPVCAECLTETDSVHICTAFQPWVENGWVPVPENERTQRRLI